jgi:hypothetical protein
MEVEKWMMMVTRSSGHSAIAVKWRVGICTLAAALSVNAAEAPVPVAPPPNLLIPPEAEAPYQVVSEAEQKVRWLDSAVFTEISPLSVPDVAVKLPEDQQE